MIRFVVMLSISLSAESQAEGRTLSAFDSAVYSAADATDVIFPLVR